MDYQRLDTNAKNFMDAVKVLARNIFYLSFETFKEKYNNYRDDHLLFRHLTRADGIIENKPGVTEISLTPKMEYQPKLKKIIAQVLNEINEMDPKMPDGSKRKIKLFLDT
ncbi:MAG: hypothetical protein P1P88_04885 [Bacteroidales bacterium]|nr:hypothetical protein [Bacteroidales bacterium]